MAAYQRQGHGQLPLTPPGSDSGSGYGYSSMQYNQESYAPVRDAYDYQQAYMSQQLAPMPTQYSSAYQQSLYTSAAATASMTTLPSISSYYEPMGAPILPPLRVQDRLSFGDDMHRIAQYDYSRDNRQSKEDKATGGVSAKLDYDMDRMTNFVVQTTQQISCQQSVSSPPAFRKWVHQVLSATRLPSATIMLSLHYLSDRIKIFPDSITNGENQIYRLLAVALILGSKFLDDNTFINRSWSDVTSIKVAELNLLELKWLRLIEYGLHVDNASVQGWVGLWNKYDLEQSREAARAVRLSPIDTSTTRHTNSRYSPYPTPYSSSTMSTRTFDTSSRTYSSPYTAVDPWAPSERPAYEDFYKRSGNRFPTLSDFDDINRRAADKHRLDAYQPTFQPYQPVQTPYSASAASGYASGWEHYGWGPVHRSDCTCSSCSYRAWRPHTAVNGYSMGTVMG